MLVWVGLKMTVLPWLLRDELTNPTGHVPIPLSLGVIVTLIGGTMLLSLAIPPKAEPASEGDGAADRDGGPNRG